MTTTTPTTNTFSQIHERSHYLWDKFPAMRDGVDRHLWATAWEYGGPQDAVDHRGARPVVGIDGLDRDFKRMLRGEAPVDARSRRVLGSALKALDDIGFVASRDNGIVRNDALRIVGRPDAVGTMNGNIDTVVELKVVERFRKTARAVDAAQVLYYALCKYPIAEVIAGNIAMVVVYVVDTWEAENTRLEMILNPAPLVPIVEELAAA